MNNERDLAFYFLLHQLEFKIGNECYNGNIQNYGPDGIWQGEGRSFRYPVTFINSKENKEKYRGRIPNTLTNSGDIAPAVLGETRYSSAYYAFGANQLHILRGIRSAVEYLETRFGLDFEKLLQEEKNQQEDP